MEKFFWYALGMPFIIIAIAMTYVIWEIFSTGEWKMKKPGLRLDFLHQGEITSLHSQMKEMARHHQTEIDELKQRHRKELQQLNRSHQLAERAGR